ncbi:MAG: SAM-dependent methyltransferase [Candidatus Poriferisodalaceae bacterium]|jgi:SAM-dependent methyltransferase
MPEPREQATVFGEVAESYHTVRAPYPDELFEMVVTVTGLPQPAVIADVGCGTGKSSAWFVARGHSVIGIEPDAAMAAIATRELGPTDRFHVDPVPLQAWIAPTDGVDLVVSGQAWHWADPPTRFVDAASALASRSGWLAVYWNRPSPDELPFAGALDEVYRSIVGSEAGRGPTLVDLRFPGSKSATAAATPADEFNQSGLFETVTPIDIPWSRTMDTDLHLASLSTQSDHRMLPDEQRDKLFEAVARVLDSHGSSYELPMTTHGCLARVRQPSEI